MDRQREDDRRRYEEESERRMQEMQKEMELLQALVSRHSATARLPRETETVKITRLSESNDIEAYLTTFEHMMGAYETANGGHLTLHLSSRGRLNKRTQPFPQMMPKTMSGSKQRVCGVTTLTKRRTARGLGAQNQRRERYPKSW